MKIRYFLVALCLLIAASAFAKGDPNLQPIAGEWACTGIAFANDMGPEHATKASVKTAWILSGRWLQVRYTEMKTTANPHPVEAEIVMTTDEGKKKVVSSCLDNNGGYCSEESETPAWTGDVMTLTGNGHFGGQDMKVRDTFTKGPGWVKHLGEAQPANGNWMKLDEETCKKQ